MGVYKYKLMGSYRMGVSTEIFSDISFESRWLLIDEEINMIVIPQYYAWDGCSPKFLCFDILWGTPDGRPHESDYKPVTYWASLVHDALYQYKGQHGITRKQADLLFYKMLKSRQFKLARLYYIAVRLFGGFYGKW